jgi:site-specific recombinase
MSLFGSVKNKWRGLKAETFGLRQDLSSLLASASPHSSLGERIQWVENLLDWIRIPATPDREQNKGGAQIQAVRVRFLLQTLERNPTWKANVSALLSSVLLRTDALSLLCETGLNHGSGFFTEALDRFMHRVLPAPRNERDLGELFSRLFSDEGDAEWLEKLDETTIGSLKALVSHDAGTQQEIEAKFTNVAMEALILLSTHAESLALSPEIRARSYVRTVRESAFFRLRMEIVRAFSARELQPNVLDMPVFRYDDLKPYFEACQLELSSALQHLEEHGVSVNIVYRIEKIERFLARMDGLARILFPYAGRSKAAEWQKLLVDLIRSRIQNDRIRTLVHDNMHMMARKLVERAGVSGEHYITTTPREYLGMIFSAAGGGVVTVGTTVLKYFSKYAYPAPFFDGVLSFLNYSGSFVFMQACHFTLATKQPSMTAPALAAKLKAARVKGNLGEFADLVARITRSQCAAAVGNIGMAIPTALLVDFIFQAVFGGHLFSQEYAAAVLKQMHPFKSPTIPYAFLTGIVLWVASMGAGWVENWFVYRRLPETISQSAFLGAALGERRAARFSAWVTKNIAGVGNSVSLGFLLAFTPVFGKFFGLPLDVRHVTLSTCAITLSITALPAGSVGTTQVALLGLSIFLMGTLNFGVSFAAALYTALKAREVKKARLSLLRTSLWEKWKREPLAFFFPPRKKAQT